MALTSKYFWQSKVCYGALALMMHFTKNRYSERGDLELFGGYFVRRSAAQMASKPKGYSGFE
jgi:hypothetical protein